MTARRAGSPARQRPKDISNGSSARFQDLLLRPSVVTDNLQILRTAAGWRTRGQEIRAGAVHTAGRSQEATIVQCAGCGTPVGALDPALGPQIEALKHQVAAIHERLNRIAKALQG